MPQPPVTDKPTAGAFKSECLAFANALMFLTRLPLPAMEYQPHLLGKSAMYFPLVGLIVGLAGGLAFHFALMLWPQSIAVTCALIVMVLCTGGFHEDGLADSADGMGGGWSRDDKLRIMKDSRIGTYGGLALILSLLLKFTALGAIPLAEILPALIAAHTLGRWSTLPLLRYCAYVGGGTGNPFIDAVTPLRLFMGSLMAWLTVAVVIPACAPVLLLSAVLITACSAWFFNRKLGGITGDSLGASNQAIEITAYLVIAASLGG